MLTAVTLPYSKTLIGAIPVIVLQSSLPVVFSLSSMDDGTVFTETYTPDANDTIRIYDIDKIIATYLTAEPDEDGNLIRYRNLAKEFTLTASNGDDEDITATFLAVRGKVNFLGDCAVFFDENFFTLLPGTKKSNPLQKEYLSFLTGTGVHTISVAATALSGNVINATLETFTPTENAVYTYLINLAAAGIDVLHLKSYVITLASGDRTITFEYVMDNAYYETAQQFLFVNSFGVPESIVFTGAVSMDMDHSKKITVNTLSGKRRVGYLEQINTIHTGILPSNEAAIWLWDFFDSEYTAIQYNGVAGARRIVVSDPQTPFNPFDALTRDYTFSYLFARERDNYWFLFTQRPVIAAITDDNETAITDDNELIITD